MVFIKYFALIFILSCARAPLEKISMSMRKTDLFIEFSDEEDKKEFIKAIKENIERVKKRRSPLPFGDRLIDKDIYVLGLEKFINIIKTSETNQELSKRVHDSFDIYETYGKDNWGEVLVTGYYTPKIFGSKRKTKKYSTPLYATPDDLVEVNLNAYRDIFDNMIFKADERDLTNIRGRIEGNKIVPYYSREEISFEKKLKGKKLELAWVDPIEAFFLQIQGSGAVQFEGKKAKTIYLHYDQQNGHGYHSIGKELVDLIPLEELSMQTIKEHLRNITPEEQKKILITNPSFVFFKVSDQKPQAYFQTTAAANRTIATDDKFFPKGALAFLQFSKSANIKSRFVLDQDKGGAIKGGYRVDLYTGEGKEAADIAGPLKEDAKLYYLAPKI